MLGHRLIICKMCKNKRLSFVCLLLAVVGVVVFVTHQQYGLPNLHHTEQIFYNRNSGQYEFSASRQLFGIHQLCNNKSCGWEGQQLSRRKLISDTCNAVKRKSGEMYPKLIYKLSTAHKKHHLKFLLVVDSVKLVYCYVPKVGTTSWKRLLLLLEGKINSTQDLGQKQTHNFTNSFIRNLSSFSLKEARRILATYRKFLFIRNPFERILSAYQDKFQNDYPASQTFRNQWSERIIRYSGGEQTETLLKEQRRSDGTINVTFPQFARYVGKSQDSDISVRYNEHWAQAYTLCHPCMVNYDWIGHYDSMQTDADRILRAARVDPTVTFPNFTTNPTGSSDADTLLRYYSQLASEEIAAIYRQYFLDFSMFGYNLPSIIRSLIT